MRLRQGLKVTIGHKTWVNEIPEEAFAIITKSWTKDQIDVFRKRHEEKSKPEAKTVSSKQSKD